MMDDSERFSYFKNCQWLERKEKIEALFRFVAI